MTRKAADGDVEDKIQWQHIDRKKLMTDNESHDESAHSEFNHLEIRLVILEALEEL